MSLGSIKNFYDNASTLGQKAIEGLSNFASKAREHVGHAISAGADFLHQAADVGHNLQGGVDAVAPAFLAHAFKHLVGTSRGVAPVIKGIGHLVSSKDYSTAKANADKLSGKVKDYMGGKQADFHVE